MDQCFFERSPDGCRDCSLSAVFRCSLQWTARAPALLTTFTFLCSVAKPPPPRAF